MPHSALVVSVFRHGSAGDPGVQLNAGRTRGAAEYRLPQGQYMVRKNPTPYSQPCTLYSAKRRAHARRGRVLPAARAIHGAWKPCTLFITLYPTFS